MRYGFKEVFAIIWSIASILYIFSVSFLYIPQNNIRFVDTIIGFLLCSAVSLILSYFYGDSDKKKKIENVTVDEKRGDTQ